MNILADTNLYIASLRYAGLKRKVLWRILETNHTLVITDFIIDELRENFKELYQPSEFQTAFDLFLQFIATGHMAVKTIEDYSSLLDQARAYVPEKDTPILAACMLADMDYLVTRDKKHFLENERLKQSPWHKKIVSPQELLVKL
jgi:predicted nucleic acid-binding protein